MGITNFNKWLNKSYPEAITKINVNSYDNVYIDLNPILHVAVNNVKNINELLKRINYLTTQILKKIIPKKKLILSTDSIPSFAKMILQRERRINMIKNMEIKTTTNFLNPIIFTPGTEFMNNLSNFLSIFFDDLKIKYPNIEITNLINLEHGESEFKLFNNMKTNIIKNNKDTNILISNDADVIIMALSMYNGINNINIGTSGKEFNEINIDKLVKCLNNKYSNLDYTVLMLLMGNDYLPKINYVNLDKILKIYHLICKNNNLVIKHNNKLSINNKLFSKIIFRLFYKNKNFKINNLDQLNTNKINNYMEGLIWCLNNYHDSTTENMLYMYKYKKLGINPIELYYYLNLNKSIIQYPNENKNIILNNKIYPAIVLPYKVNFLIKNSLPDYILKNYKEYYDEELCEKCKDYTKKICNLNISKKFLEDTESDDINILKIKNNIKEINLLYNSHKKIKHKRVSFDKYIEIISDLNRI